MVPTKEIFNVNPLDGEVFANIVNISSGFDVLFHFRTYRNNYFYPNFLQIFLHGPYEVADASSKGISSENGYFLQLYLSALALFTSERAKNLKPSQRKCRFYYESTLQHSPVYSYVLCRMECRITLAKKLCNCIPHFYRKLGR